MTIDSTDQRSANRLQDNVISTLSREILRDGVSKIARSGLAIGDEADGMLTAGTALTAILRSTCMAMAAIDAKAATDLLQSVVDAIACDGPPSADIISRQMAAQQRLYEAEMRDRAKSECRGSA